MKREGGRTFPQDLLASHTHSRGLVLASPGLPNRSHTGYYPRLTTNPQRKAIFTSISAFRKTGSVSAYKNIPWPGPVCMLHTRCIPWVCNKRNLGHVTNISEKYVSKKVPTTPRRDLLTFNYPTGGEQMVWQRGYSNEALGGSLSLPFDLIFSCLPKDVVVSEDIFNALMSVPLFLYYFFLIVDQELSRHTFLEDDIQGRQCRAPFKTIFSTPWKTASPSQKPKNNTKNWETYQQTGFHAG